MLKIDSTKHIWQYKPNPAKHLKQHRLFRTIHEPVNRALFNIVQWKNIDCMESYTAREEYSYLLSKV